MIDTNVMTLLDAARTISTQNMVVVIIATVLLCGAVLWVVLKHVAAVHISNYNALIAQHNSLIEDHKSAREAYHDSLKNIIEKQQTFMETLNMNLGRNTAVLSLVSSQINEYQQEHIALKRERMERELKHK